LRFQYILKNKKKGVYFLIWKYTPFFIEIFTLPTKKYKFFLKYMFSIPSIYNNDFLFIADISCKHPGNLRFGAAGGPNGLNRIKNRGYAV